MHIWLHLIWFHEIHVNYVKRILQTLLLIEYIFTKKQETKRKMSVKVKPWLKNGLYTSAFNNMLAELIVNDALESILLRITIFFLLNRTNGMSYPGLLSLSI